MLCVQGRVCAGVYSSLVFRKPDVKPRDNSTTATAHRGTTAQHQDTAQRGTGPQRDQPRRRVIENQPHWLAAPRRRGAGRGGRKRRRRSDGGGRGDTAWAFMPCQLNTAPYQRMFSYFYELISICQSFSDIRNSCSTLEMRRKSRVIESLSRSIRITHTV